MFHDEIDLRPAKVRVKTGGGVAGHNGLRSISAHVGNDYRRVRIGVGHPGVKELVHPHVLSDFAKDERPWVEALCGIIADNAELLVKGQDASFQNKVHLGMQAKGFGEPKERGRDGRLSKMADNTRDVNGLQMRHPRPVQCRQVDGLQCADRDRGGAGVELSIQHHRAECRRGHGAGSAARRARQAGEVGQAQADPAHLRRYRGPGERRLQGRRPRQPVPRPCARGRRHRARGALLRRSRRRPMSPARSTRSPTSTPSRPS